MNSSQLTGDAEECSSCDSGWTKYLSSPVHGNHDGGDDTSEVELLVLSEDCSTDTDDSMASDASTGLLHNKHSDLSCDEDDVVEAIEAREEEEKKKPNSSYSYKKLHKVEQGRNGSNILQGNGNSKSRKTKLK